VPLTHDALSAYAPRVFTCYRQTEGVRGRTKGETESDKNTHTIVSSGTKRIENSPAVRVGDVIIIIMVTSAASVRHVDTVSHVIRRYTDFFLFLGFFFLYARFVAYSRRRRYYYFVVLLFSLTEFEN